MGTSFLSCCGCDYYCCCCCYEPTHMRGSNLKSHMQAPSCSSETCGRASSCACGHTHTPLQCTIQRNSACCRQICASAAPLPPPPGLRRMAKMDGWMGAVCFLLQVQPKPKPRKKKKHTFRTRSKTVLQSPFLQSIKLSQSRPLCVSAQTDQCYPQAHA